MNLTDPRSQAAFDAAINHIRTTTAAVADRVATHLGILASAATRIIERDALITAQIDLRRNMSTYVLVLGDTLSKRLAREVNPDRDSRRLAETDWQSLSLVDDSQVEEQMLGDRIAQAITHGCEWELRDLAAYTGAMLGLGRALGETMAVAIILSVSGAVTFNLISSGNPSTIAANIALEFPEATGLENNTLIASGLVQRRPQGSACRGRKRPRSRTLRSPGVKLSSA